MHLQSRSSLPSMRSTVKRKAILTRLPMSSSHSRTSSRHSTDWGRGSITKQWETSPSRRRSWRPSKEWRRKKRRRRRKKRRRKTRRRKKRSGRRKRRGEKDDEGSEFEHV